MKVYVVVTVFSGCVNEVNGFVDPGAADACVETKQQELGIMPGFEEQSEHDVQLHELDILIYPESVAVERQYI
uniref:Uncharacterized protein n=1 Tax=viral metagenome TaxID=1070528 RepID=A0A6M3M5D6_9ZZZZ